MMIDYFCCYREVQGEFFEINKYITFTSRGGEEAYTNSKVNENNNVVLQ